VIGLSIVLLISTESVIEMGGEESEVTRRRRPQARSTFAHAP